jgi:hypothetical protein
LKYASISLSREAATGSGPLPALNQSKSVERRREEGWGEWKNRGKGIEVSGERGRGEKEEQKDKYRAIVRYRTPQSVLVQYNKLMFSTK